MRWDIERARSLAAEHLEANEARWLHVRGVGRLAEQLVQDGLVDEVVAAVAWLHDLGYSHGLVDTGLHALDGARFLAAEGGPPELVGLVAHHTGAAYEAEERGLADELAALPAPKRTNLEALTLVDLSVGPDGRLMMPAERLAEVLTRYREDSPVFRAVSRSTSGLLKAAEAARVRLGLPDEWPVLPAQRMVEAQSH